uniref:Uncharacterized protein n=1 Tax=Oryza meyeriana var. granulata TaxID=110450 RepID=A0A1V1H1B5_9ORYZ|nr:hypothetical protein [Oryza meyeriana var. granulata]
MAAAPQELQPKLDQLKKKEADLLVELEKVRKDLEATESQLIGLPQAIQDQKAKVVATVRQVIHRRKNLKTIPGSDEDDIRAINEIDQIRLHAIKTIQKFM